MGRLPGLWAQEGAVFAPRIKVSINDGWSFSKSDSTPKELVTLPHSWNTTDPFDEVPGYNRGVAFYEKSLKELRHLPSRPRTYLYFEGANQSAEVRLNGQLVGTHTGGYTAFATDLTSFLESEGNLLEVSVDNRHDPNVPPLRGDFNFYGGIYRDVYLILTGNTHFEILDHAAPGILIQTPEVDSSQALVKVSARIMHHERQKMNARIIVEIRDAEGQVVQTAQRATTLLSGKNTLDIPVELSTPRLWSPAHPYLYTVSARIVDNEQGVLDEIRQPLGLRWFAFDENEGFFLNGRHLSLRGVNRHQDQPGKANALGNASHLQDIQLIKEMGANFLRTAHYPQDPAVLQACDRLGLLVSMEIPLDHDITNSEAFYEHTRNMMREMIQQYHNHPSIVIWAYMNEMFLGRSLEKDREAIQEIVAFARDLETLTRKEDPYRYTMIPNHGDFDVYHQSGLTEIPMIVGWNLYYGWYEPDVNGFGTFMDRAHRTLPEKPLMLTEYGAGADPRLRAAGPKRFDFSQEWESDFHHHHLIQLEERPYIAGSAVWNMFDFGSASRKDAVPAINNKGLCTFGRQPKDAYYYYKAWLSSSPFLKILPQKGGFLYGLRDTVQQEVCMVGNVEEAMLFHNDNLVGAQPLINHRACWEVALSSGKHTLSARAGEASSDEIEFEIQVLQPGKPLTTGLFRINAGTHFTFRETEEDTPWLPEPDEKEWQWIEGGRKYEPRNRGIGTDWDILGTSQDPLYQTQRIGIRKIALPLAPGSYEIMLLFAELEQKAAGERRFDIQANGHLLARGLDIAYLAGTYRAYEQSYEVIVGADGLLKVEFIPDKGEPIINAIQIKKIGY